MEITIMYCSTKNCFKEAIPAVENYRGLCAEHLAVQKTVKVTDEQIKQNLKSLQEVEARIKARKEKESKQ